MDEKKQLYTLKWVQPYIEWEQMNEELAEMKLETSEWTESAQVITHIMGLK